jgi:DNA polymerase III epsilon subunit-like protein
VRKGDLYLNGTVRFTMTKLLLIDTETNGLPKNRFAPISMTEAYPAILQISWSLFTLSGKELTHESSRDITVALDPSVPWDEGAAAIHNISEKEARSGVSPIHAFTELSAVLASADMVVAHNLSFDKPVIRAAAYACGLKTLWPESIQELCTMRETRDLCRLPSQRPDAYKLPKLNELYAFLYGQPYDISGNVLHTSKSDVDCLAKCVSMLLQKEYLSLESALTSK